MRLPLATALVVFELELKRDKKRQLRSGNARGYALIGLALLLGAVVGCDDEMTSSRGSDTEGFAFEASACASATTHTKARACLERLRPSTAQCKTLDDQKQTCLGAVRAAHRGRPKACGSAGCGAIPQPAPAGGRAEQGSGSAG